MKKYRLLFLLAALPLFLMAQKPEKVRSMTRVEKDLDYYSTQSKLWEKATLANPKNGDGWFNYYAAARYTNRFTAGEEKPYDLQKIVGEAKKAVPNTFEYNYLQYSLGNGDPEAFTWLEKAYALAPNRHETYSGFITHYEKERNLKKVKEFAQKWYDSADNSPGLLTWNYNMLIGLEKNAILFTNGDNDTYPSWILQHAKGIRKDVLVINTSLLMVDSYRNLLIKELGMPAFDKTMEAAGAWQAMQNETIEHFIQHSGRPVYLAISCGRALRDHLEENLYLTGMAFRYSAEEYDGTTPMVEFYEQKMLTDQFKTTLQNDPAQSALNQANLNYLPALIKLLKHYREVEDTGRVLLLKNQIRQVATAGGRGEHVEKYLKE